MKERIKSIVLVLLVAASLLQSYMLIYNAPTLSEPFISREDPLENEMEPLGEPFGVTLQADQLIYPEQIVIRDAQGERRVLAPRTPAFNKVYDVITTRNFADFLERDISGLNEDAMRTGVEFRYGGGFSFALLARVLRLELTQQERDIEIARIGFYENARQEVNVYFFSSDGQHYYTPRSTDYAQTELATMLKQGRYIKNYEEYGEGGLYIPQAAFAVTGFTFDFEKYSISQIEENLFFDTKKTREFTVRSGSKIYTDGKRALQIDDNTWMKLSDPKPGMQQTMPLTSTDVMQAISYVNQHGGWEETGAYRLLSTRKQGIIFQQYYNYMPIVRGQLNQLQYGYIEIQMSQSNVSEYERTLLNLRENPHPTQYYLPGGAALQTALQETLGEAQPAAIYSAYQPQLTQVEGEAEQLTLLPVWVARMPNNTEILVAQAYGTMEEAQAVSTVETESGAGEEAN
jgi:regulatory protein YycH of two-component signal transduction system YycFG